MVKIVGCPREGDPMEHMDEFIGGDLYTLSGYKMDGLEKLRDTVLAELSKREPGTRTVVVDRDWLYDRHVDFARDLKKAMAEEAAKDGKVNFIIYKDIPVIDWQTALDGLDPEKAQVYYFTNACLQVPCCYRLIQKRRRRSLRGSETPHPNAIVPTMSGGKYAEEQWEWTPSPSASEADRGGPGGRN